MKVLTKEEADAHYRATLKGGAYGGLIGFGIGLTSAALMNYRFRYFRSLTLPLKAFYVTSVGTFVTVIAADRASRSFELNLYHGGADILRQREAAARERQRAAQTPYERAMTWGREHRYSIVGLSWVGSMAASLGLVWRDKYLTKAQKLVQARVYAQGLTLLVLIATAAFEVADARYQQRRAEEMIVDPEDPEGKRMVRRGLVEHQEQWRGEDLWKTMVANEERRLKEKKKLEHKE